MPQTSNFILPYEPEYTGHREEEKRREETREWLRERKRELELMASEPKRNASHPKRLRSCAKSSY